MNTEPVPNSVSAWLLFSIIQMIAFVVMLFGILLLLPLCALRYWTIRESRYFPGRTIAVWRGGWLTWIWGNEEDGVIGADFFRARFKDERLSAYLWSAWRNPANNLRFIFQWKGGPFWRRERSGWYVQAGWNSSGYPVLSGGRM